MVILRDDLFLYMLAFFRKTHHPVQLALNRPRRGNCADKTQI